MAINHAIRLFGVVVLAGLATPLMKAQGASDPTKGGSQDAAVSAVPAIMSQGPAKTPKVTCAGDQLTISANNATLGSVLAAVHACIGVQIDIPEGAGKSRTFEELGPGPEREVLEELLSGTGFNYVIGSSDADPGKIETILLMERSTEIATNAQATDRALTSARRAWPGSLRAGRRADSSGDDSAQIAEETPEATAVDEPPTPPAPAENANAAPASIPPAAPATDVPAPTADAPTSLLTPSEGGPTVTGSPAPELSPSVGLTTDTGKSTTDRITQMQQMFEQRKQINQGQSSANAQQQ